MTKILLRQHVIEWFKLKLNRLQISLNVKHTSSHKCDICKKYFSEKNLLTLHIKKAHVNKRLSNCGVCNKDFTTVLEVLQHIEQYHFGKPQLECHTCNVIYYNEIDLNEHKETVHGLQSSSLNLTGRKPYECEHSQEGFGEKELFENHVESVHEGKKPFKCIKLNFNFNSLLAHLIS